MLLNLKWADLSNVIHWPRTQLVFPASNAFHIRAQFGLGELSNASEMKYGWKGRILCWASVQLFDLCLCWLHIIFSASDQAGPVGLCLQIHTLSLSLYLTRTLAGTRTHAFLHSFEGFRTLVIVLGMLSQKMLWIPICGCAAKWMDTISLMLTTDSWP